MPKVSVIIPTYNRAELVHRAITSVLNQTFHDFDVIVVDNGSADNTREVVTGFADQRVKYFWIEVNNGVSPARNLGIVKSSGEYVAFLDDDDEWLSQKLELQVQVMKNCPTSVAGVYTGYNVVDRSSELSIDRVTPRKRGNLLHELCIVNCIGTASTVLLRRDCVEKVGLFDDNIPFAEEYDLWIRLSREFQFECIESPLVKYSVHVGNSTYNYHAMVKGLEALDKKHGVWFAQSRKGCSNRYLALGVLYCYTDEFQKGRAAFLKAIKLNPFALRHYFNLCLLVIYGHDFRRMKQREERFTATLRSCLQQRRWSLGRFSGKIAE